MVSEGGLLNDAVLEDEAAATTLAVRYLPPDLEQASARQWVDDAGFEGAYDFFLWFPAKYTLRHHCSYAYINFKSTELAHAFTQAKHGSRFSDDERQIPLRIVFASVQGFAKNYARFGNPPKVAVLRSSLPFFDESAVAFLPQELVVEASWEQEEEAEQEKTTVIVSNLPPAIATQGVAQDEARLWFDGIAGLQGDYNFFLLVPPAVVSRSRTFGSWKTPTRGNYVLVNFRDASSADACVKNLQGKLSNDLGVRINVNFASIQGYDSLLDHFARLWASGHIHPWVQWEEPATQEPVVDAQSFIGGVSCAELPLATVGAIHSASTSAVALDDEPATPASPVRGAPPDFEHIRPPPPPTCEPATTAAACNQPPDSEQASARHDARDHRSSTAAPPFFRRSTVASLPRKAVEKAPVPLGTTAAAAEEFDAAATTLALRNLPPNLEQASARRWVDDAGYKGDYDFLVWFPPKSTSRRLGSYAYINFRSPSLARAFKKAKLGSRFSNEAGQLPLKITAASVQGFAENYARFGSGSAFFDESALASLPQKQNEVCSRQDESEELRTTVMVSNLPRCIETEDEAQAWFNATAGYKGCYDLFLLVPPEIMRRTRSYDPLQTKIKGSCIIVNFRDAGQAKSCVTGLDGKRFDDDDPRIKVVYSSVQGHDNCVDDFSQLRARDNILPYAIPELHESTAKESPIVVKKVPKLCCEAPSAAGPPSASVSFFDGPSLSKDDLHAARHHREARVSSAST